MQFLKTLFWVVLAVMLVLFANANWIPVQIRLWGGLEADVKLPALLMAAFLLGLVPMLVLHRARLWSLHRRLESQERQFAAAQTPVVPPARATTAATPPPESHEGAES